MNILLRAKQGRGMLTVALGVAMMAGSASAADFELCAGATEMSLPDGTVVPMWGFAPGGGGPDGCVNEVTIPGPMLTVPPGDTELQIILTNTLPEPVSIVIPGQYAPLAPVTFTDPQGRERIRSLTAETGAGATETYLWDQIRPGSYLYHSGTHPAVQVQMGLYGGVIQDFAAGMAYDGVPYDNQVILYYSEIDPDLHAAVGNGTYGGAAMSSTIDYRPRYFFINGVPYSENPAVGAVAGNAGESTLIRFFNMGLESHVPTVLNTHLDLVAEDGNPYPYPREGYAVHLAAGKTMDGLVFHPAAGAFSLLDHALFTDYVAAPVNTCAADLDNDGDVDLADLNVFRVEFGRRDCGATVCQADLDDDGDVDLADLNGFRIEFGRRDCLAP